MDLLRRCFGVGGSTLAPDDECIIILFYTDFAINILATTWKGVIFCCHAACTSGMCHAVPPVKKKS